MIRREIPYKEHDGSRPHEIFQTVDMGFEPRFGDVSGTGQTGVGNAAPTLSISMLDLKRDVLCGHIDHRVQVLITLRFASQEKCKAGDAAD